MAYVLEHRTTKSVARGLPYPLGPTLTITGINRKARSVSRLKPSCDRIAARRFHEFDERAPEAQAGLRAVAVAPQDVSQTVGERVDVVPPGARDDHLLVHRQCAERLHRGVPPGARQLDRRIAMLAMRRAAPERQDGVVPGGEVLEGMASEQVAAGAAQRRGRDTEVRHGRLHVTGAQVQRRRTISMLNPGPMPIRSP
jgi:hypothetical protein